MSRLPHLLLSGPICVGKTTLAGQLARDRNYKIVSARAALRAIAGGGLDSRRALQKFGEKLETNTRGEWIFDVLRREVALDDRRVILDALRTSNQAAAARLALEPNVVHVHLTAQRSALADRFEHRAEADILEPDSFDDALGTDLELTADLLVAVADTVLDTTVLSPAEVLASVTELLDRA